MRSMLDAKRGEWLEYLRQRPDRPRVTTVLLSAAGAPGAARLIRALRENGEREVRVVGTDMSERAIGRHLCDAFHVVPAGIRSGLRRRDPRARRARARRRRPAAVVVRPRGARRRARDVPRAGARVVAGDDPPLERQGGELRAAAADRRADGRVPPRRRRARGRGGGARARLPGPARLLQAGVLVRARAASGSSTRPSTARTSCCTSGPDRWRCAGRGASSCCPRATRPSCS